MGEVIVVLVIVGWLVGVVFFVVRSTKRKKQRRAEWLIRAEALGLEPTQTEGPEISASGAYGSLPGVQRRCRCDELQQATHRRHWRRRRIMRTGPLRFPSTAHG